MVENTSQLVDFDADAGLTAAREVAGDAVHAVIEYTPDAFSILYASPETLDTYGGREAMLDHFDEVHSYVHIDFTERDLFSEELLPHAGEVRSIVTRQDRLTLVRLFHADAGLVISLDPDEPIVPVLDAVESAI
ncbi:hypothetical protein [Salinirubrum litoreum]|uniref:SnoaL-like domain-containing protein n=1 Tax=Salinirubrum litoreum TaxID=1126234 RepID=A0ABD5RCA0_9EURY|nr:hypothetical protein [Salinirubrum litoreum]